MEDLQHVFPMSTQSPNLKNNFLHIIILLNMQHLQMDVTCDVIMWSHR
jgi:hypothetical protein